MLFSFLRESVRDTLIPHVSLFGLKFSVRNGISTSKLHPVLLRWTRSFQIPSHCRFWPLVPISASAIAPDGLVSKKYPVRPSRNVSIVHWTLSSC
jgi:hypothetical protein